MKKIITLLLATLMVISLTACSTKETEETTTTEEKKQLKIGYSSMGNSGPFQKCIYDTVQEIVEENGDIFVGTDGEDSQQVQNDRINEMILQGIDVLLVAPYSSDGILPALVACKEAGIPVINVDNPATDLDYVESLIASNNYECGAAIARYWLDQGGSGTVLCVTDSACEGIKLRCDGWTDTVTAAGVEMITVEYGDAIVAKTEDLMTAYPDAECYFSVCVDMAVPAIASIKAHQYENMKVFSVDGAPDEKLAVKNGELEAVAAQSPINIGKKATEVAYKLLNGETIEKEYLIEPIIIDITNVDQYGYDGWQ